MIALDVRSNFLKDESQGNSDRAYSRNLGQRSILARKGTFLCFDKMAPKISPPPPPHHPHPPPPNSIPFLSVLHQNKALYNFRKRVQYSIVECNIGLEYALTDFVFK